MKTLHQYKICLSILLLSFINNNLWAHNTNNRIWSSLGFNGNYGKFSYQLEPQLRINENPVQFHQFLTNLGGGYNFSSCWALWAGATQNLNRQNNGSYNRQFRFWEQIFYRQPIGPIGLILRNRFEQRKRLDYKHWNYRARERIILTKPLTATINLIGYDEVFFNLNRPEWVRSRWFDQNRVFIGLNQQASELLIFEVAYIHQLIFTTPTQLNHVVSLSAQIIFPDIS